MINNLTETIISIVLIKDNIVQYRQSKRRSQSSQPLVIFVFSYFNQISLFYAASFPAYPTGLTIHDLKLFEQSIDQLLFILELWPFHFLKINLRLFNFMFKLR